MRIAPSPLILRFQERYRRIFSIQEIADQPILQWMMGAMLLFFYAVFTQWNNEPSVTVETAARGGAICWPYFEACGKLFFLKALPFGYSETEFYALLFGILAAIVWCMWSARWNTVHALTCLLWVWEVLHVFLFSYPDATPYYYYHILLTAILLFIPYKEYFLKICFVFLYFMSVTTKLDATWILGTYFSSLKLGLPIFPRTLIPLMTNLVIFMQVVGCWFLLSRHRILQRLSLLFFAVFHLYSAIFVQYLYPTISLPPLLILFGPLYRFTPPPVSWRATGGWIILALIALFQLAGFITPTERLLTLEGDRFGMYMFEANHQCVATVQTYYTKPPGSNFNWQDPPGTPCKGFYCLVQTSTYQDAGETVIETRYESGTSWNRCDPYEWWAQLHTQCALNPTISRVALQFDHSINGGPFYEIVNEPNMCNLTYQIFAHNDWIKEPPAAPIVGYPVENSYHY